MCGPFFENMDDYLKVGTITQPFGIKGEMKVFPHTDDPKRFKKLNTPLGSPLRLNFYFRKKHIGLVHALLFDAKVILINIMPDWMVVMIWGDMYKDK